MKIKIKYGFGDYYKAIKYRLALSKANLKANKQKYEYVVMRIIGPVVALFISTKAVLTKLKPTYTFQINDKGIKRSHNGIDGKMTWGRIHYYRETASFYLLEFTNKGEDSSSSILIPKRFLSDEQNTELTWLLLDNEIKLMSD